MAIERRYDAVSEMRKMALVDGYVMARRPDCYPFVVSENRWAELSRTPLTDLQRAEARAAQEADSAEAQRLVDFLRRRR